MKLKIFILLSLIILTASVLYNSYRSEKKTQEDSPSVITEENNADSPGFETKTAQIGNVAYSVTPKNLSPAGTFWEFEIVLDTHSGSLDQDPIRIFSIDDGNNRFKALSWEGDPPGGHHRKGVLQFESVDTASESLMIIIKEDKQEEVSISLESLKNGGGE